MRLDKYLQVSRLIKRREVGKEACAAGRVKLNDRPAKGGDQVKPGDRIFLEFGERGHQVEILEIRETVNKAQARELYKVLTDSNRETRH